MKETDDVLFDEALCDLALAGDKLLAMKSEVGERLLFMVDAILCYVENTIYDDFETYGLAKPKRKRMSDARVD